MLMDHKGKITVKIEGIAASAASVIAMAGGEVLMSPSSMMMIHNPETSAYGWKDEMEKALDILDEVKESIINAYELKTGLSRHKISRLMDDETWMNAKKAKELGFCDRLLFTGDDEEEEACLLYTSALLADKVYLLVKPFKDVYTIPTIKSVSYTHQLILSKHLLVCPPLTVDFP